MGRCQSDGSLKLDKLNQWLMLTANLGVLIGITAVVFELRQTQTAMDAEASSMRAQMTMDLLENSLDAKIHEVFEKLSNGQELSLEERARASMWVNTRLRHFENLHYQYQIGVLDEEIWQAVLQGLGDICGIPIFNQVYPNWDSSTGSAGFRESFASVVAGPCR